MDPLDREGANRERQIDSRVIGVKPLTTTTVATKNWDRVKYIRTLVPIATHRISHLLPIVFPLVVYYLYSLFCVCE